MRNKLTGLSKRFTKEQQKRHVRVGSILVVILFFIALAAINKHYHDYPGMVDHESITVEDKGTDFIELSWDPTRNTDGYHVYYKTAAEDEDSGKDGSKDTETYEVFSEEEWEKTDTTEARVRIDGLKEGTKYSFTISSDKEGRRGGRSKIKNYTTQKEQEIDVADEIVKFVSSESFYLGAEADTELSYSTDDKDVLTVAEDTGRVVIEGAGKAKIKVKAAENGLFTADKETVDVTVYDIEPSAISGSDIRIIKYLDSDNCEKQFKVEGVGSAVAPQGMAYTGDQYMICFGEYGNARIVSYDTDGSNRSVETPKNSLGHPNGFTYSPDSGLCYCVRGNSSTCVIYDTKTGEYKTITMPTGCSGISYDRVRKTLCTSARKSIIEYDPDTYKTLKRYGVVTHSGTVYRQDCECYDGIMMHIISGSNRHGTNYIDLYDMDKGEYLGTLQCDLSEIESIIVNDEGYLVILANGSSRADYIWKTDVNIRLIADELRRIEAQENAE